MVNSKNGRCITGRKDVDVKEHDQIDPAIDTDISKDMKINIEPAFQVTVNDAGKQRRSGRLRLRSLTFKTAKDEHKRRR